jgi:hypothetical protein
VGLAIHNFRQEAGFFFDVEIDDSVGAAGANAAVGHVGEDQELVFGFGAEGVEQLLMDKVIICLIFGQEVDLAGEAMPECVSGRYFGHALLLSFVVNTGSRKGDSGGYQNYRDAADKVINRKRCWFLKIMGDGLTSGRLGKD